MEEQILKVTATDQCGLAFCDTVKEQHQQDQSHDSRDQGIIERALAVLDVLFGWLKSSPSMRNTSDNYRRDELFINIVAGRHLNLDEAVIDNATVAYRLLPYLDTALERPELVGTNADRRIVSRHILDQIENQQGLLEGMSRIYNSILGKRTIFTTDGGEVGLGPPLMDVGDRIAYIAGVGLAIGLRSHKSSGRGRKYFSVIGPAYFHPHGFIETDIK